MKNDTIAYTSEWFDTPYYAILYCNRNFQEAAEFIHRLWHYLSPAKGAAFLDACCGNGRHAYSLAHYGMKGTGIDLSKNAIQQAILHNPYPDRLNFIQGNLFHHHFNSSFDYIFNFFTSFGYYSDKKNSLLITLFHQLLNPSGILVLDYLNEKQVRKKLIAYEKISREGILFSICRYIKNNYVIKEITIQENTGKTAGPFYEKVKLYSAKELVQIITRQKFLIKKTFGSYFLDDFCENSERLIIIAEKK